MRWLVILVILSCPGVSKFSRISQQVTGQCKERTIVKLFKSSDTANWYVQHYTKKHLIDNKENIDFSKVYEICNP